MKIILSDTSVGMSKPRGDTMTSPHYPPNKLNHPTQHSLTRGTPRKEQTIILCSLYISPSIGDM